MVVPPAELEYLAVGLVLAENLAEDLVRAELPAADPGLGLLQGALRVAGHVLEVLRGADLDPELLLAALREADHVLAVLPAAGHALEVVGSEELLQNDHNYARHHNPLISLT